MRHGAHLTADLSARHAAATIPSAVPPGVPVVEWGNAVATTTSPAEAQCELAGMVVGCAGAAVADPGDVPEHPPVVIAIESVRATVRRPCARIPVSRRRQASILILAEQAPPRQEGNLSGPT